MRTALAAIATLLAAATTSAHAETDSYRVEVGAIDAAATGLVIGTGVVMDDHSAVPLYLATAVAILAAPIDHAAHDNVTGAAVSLFAHLGLPVIGGAIGNTSGEGLNALPGIFVGVVVGHLAAIGVDLALAHADHDTSPTPRMISYGAQF